VGYTDEKQIEKLIKKYKESEGISISFQGGQTKPKQNKPIHHFFTACSPNAI